MFRDEAIFERAIKLAEAALSAPKSDACGEPVAYPGRVAELIQAIYDKLSEINKTIKN